MIPVCDHPGSKMRLNHTWNKLDFVAMAKKAGEIGRLIIEGLEDAIQVCYRDFVRVWSPDSPLLKD